jgi:hypothetical protein
MVGWRCAAPLDDGGASSRARCAVGRWALGRSRTGRGGDDHDGDHHARGHVDVGVRVADELEDGLAGAAVGGDVVDGRGLTGGEALAEPLVQAVLHGAGALDLSLGPESVGGAEAIFEGDLRGEAHNDALVGAVVAGAVVDQLADQLLKLSLAFQKQCDLHQKP